MVAEQWCGVRPDDTVPEHLRELVAVLRGIDPEDVPAVEQLARMISDKHTAELKVQRFTPRPAMEEDEVPYTQD
ncbi:hypothetical protein [Streptomyces sp. NPDC058424]|uniref:hypothetical protein n=1 Tax=Streptomyces sp. NPDC058424 TaxID=3346491 RepID=UPI0036592C9C